MRHRDTHQCIDGIVRGIVDPCGNGSDWVGLDDYDVPDGADWVEILRCPNGCAYGTDDIFNMYRPSPEELRAIACIAEDAAAPPDGDADR